MRLHRLSVTAFGPFPGLVELDLDALGAGGLFLVHGATGAGKTSLLDAICFALYADVPGTRASRGLRSDHAARDAVPTVVLEFTASARRLRITRTAAFDRPKQRGTGERRIQATVQLEELIRGTWVARSTRPDEVGEMVLDVVGMGLTQFATVVLLPQGDFAAFLRAGAEDRRALLERLFDVSLYTGIEDWLATRRRLLGQTMAEQERSLRADLVRLGDAVIDVPDTPDAVPGATLSGVAIDQAADAAAEALAAVEAWSTQTMTEYSVAAAAADAATTEHHRAVAAAGARAKGLLARSALDQLDLGAEAVDLTRARVGAAQRGATVSGHVAARDRDGAALLAAEKVVSSSVHSLRTQHLVPLEDEVTAASLANLMIAVARHDAPLSALDRIATSLRDARTDIAARTTRLDRAQAQEPMLVQAISVAVAAVRQARALLGEVTEADHALPGLRTAHREATRMCASRAAQDHATAQRDRLTNEVHLAHSAELDARQHLLDLREARIAGMAAELADRLVDGDLCPVCGSADHPSPAVGLAPVSATALEEADDTHERLRASLSLVREELAAVEAGIATRAAELGGVGDRAVLEALVRSTQETADAHSEVAQQRDVAERALAQTETAQSAAVERLDLLRQQLSADREVVSGLQESITRLTAEEAGLIADHRSQCPCTAKLSAATLPWREPVDHEPVAHEPVAHEPVVDTPGDVEPVGAVTARHRNAVTSIRRAVTAVGDVDAARARLETGDTDLARAMDDAGFAEVEQVRAALLEPSALRELAEQVGQADRARVAAESALSDPEVGLALSGADPDLTSTAAQAQAAAAQATRTQAAQTLAARALRSASDLCPQIVERSRSMAPTAHEAAVLADLADAVTGTGGGNDLRMRLSSFVLAARLERVAELANERLSIMGQGRYRLSHSDLRASHGRRSGLGLQVSDLWTGQSRETATLSGGEAFMVSLALALGLADAVREESGGLDLQTLVIDEGFGSLDDESLEQVLEVLDTLREGGRAVGVVSHVAELRARIPSQVRVDKRENGSTLEVLLAGSASPAA